MKKFNLTAVLFICSALAAFNTQAQQPRIINGKPASTSTYPWMASISILGNKDSDDGGGCGGSLIAPDWILTAAHCFENEEGNAIADDPASLTTVRLNTDNIVDIAAGTIERSAKRVIIHPSYDPNPDSSENVHDYDIALIELSALVGLAPVKLYTGAIPAHLPTIVAGWGGTVGEDGSEPSDTLLQTQLVTSTADICNLAQEGLITSNMFCADGYTDIDTSDSCQGDSGGPLFVNLAQGSMQIGVVSFGGSDDTNCGTPGSPGVYASISALAGFINEHVTGMTLIDSLADVRTYFNIYDPVTETVTIPKVYVDNLIYSATLKLKNEGNLHFFLAAAEVSSSDDPDAIPSIFDGTRNKLLLPQVKVGPDTFNVTLRLLEDAANFEFVVETASKQSVSHP